MNAWQVLTSQSLLISGTAWEHLNNQQGGNNTFYFDYACGVSTEMTILDLGVTMGAVNTMTSLSAIKATPSLEVLDNELSVIAPQYPIGAMMALEGGDWLIDEDGNPVIVE